MISLVKRTSLSPKNARTIWYSCDSANFNSWTANYAKFSKRNTFSATNLIENKNITNIKDRFGSHNFTKCAFHPKYWLLFTHLIIQVCISSQPNKIHIPTKRKPIRMTFEMKFTWIASKMQCMIHTKIN